ncbi:MAG: hypothetical protein JWM34_2058 [Ilumatobacteraceae bacterium]|nr:hypothetical protein [Ilumatobacteraceae bacterium]
MLGPMKSRVVAVGMSAVSLLGFTACGSDSGTGAAPATTIKLGTPSYQTLAPIITSAPTSTALPGGAQLVAGEQSYTVVSGDILVRIAKKYCITAQQVVDFNGWTDSFNHALYPGDKVRIPPNACAGNGETTVTQPVTAATSTGTAATTAATTTATATSVAAGPGGTYTVVAGDYLSGIAKKTGTTVDGIVSANGWSDGSNHAIYPGEKIKLPAKTG